MSNVEGAVEFLERQRSVQSSFFAASQGQFALSFLGTSSTRGIAVALSLHPLLGLERVAGGPLRVELQGELQRGAFAGESVTISLTDWERFRGYQLKTETAVSDEDPRLCEALGAGRLALTASQVFTVHHTPNTVHMFETIPVEDVVETARVARWAVVGVGTAANVSPRFLTSFEVNDGVLALFHGDGHFNKTWMNLQQNTDASHLVFDRADGTGYLFEGRCEEITADAAPRAYAETQLHYPRLGYGPPARVYRQLVRRLTAVRA